MCMEFDGFGSRSFDDAEAIDSEAPAGATPRSSLLQRIADTIGVTVDMFRDECPTRAERSPATTAEVHALLDAFLALHAPAARHRCISLASAELANSH